MIRAKNSGPVTIQRIVRLQNELLHFSFFFLVFFLKEVGLTGASSKSLSYYF